MKNNLAKTYIYLVNREVYFPWPSKGQKIHYINNVQILKVYSFILSLDHSFFRTIMSQLPYGLQMCINYRNVFS